MPTMQANTNTEPESQPRSIRDQFFRFLRLLAIAYLLICLLMMLFETLLVYPIPTPMPEGQVSFDENSEDVEFQSQDGTELHGRYYPHRDARGVILYCHGNGEDVSQNDTHMVYLRDKLQASIFIFDYRGYGRSHGSPNEQGVIEDGLAAQRWLAGRTDLTTQEVVLYGRSLGGAVAVAIAEQQGAKALILHSTFSSMPDVAAAHYPWLPVRLLMRNRYPSEERVRNFACPLIQFHGTEDKIVPLALGKRLFDAAPGKPKRFVEIRNGDHNGPLPESGYRALVDFLAGLLSR